MIPGLDNYEILTICTIMSFMFSWLLDKPRPEPISEVVRSDPEEDTPNIVFGVYTELHAALEYPQFYERGNIGTVEEYLANTTQDAHSGRLLFITNRSAEDIATTDDLEVARHLTDWRLSPASSVAPAGFVTQEALEKIMITIPLSNDPSKLVSDEK